MEGTKTRVSVLEGFLLAYLGILSIQDIRKKKVSLWLLSVGIVFVFAYFILNSVSLPESLIGGGIGILMLGISLITKESIGKADCILIGYLGLMMGYIQSIMILLISLFLCCIFCIIGTGFHLLSRKKRVAFIPFLLAGFLCTILFVNT